MHRPTSPTVAVKRTFKWLPVRTVDEKVVLLRFIRNRPTLCGTLTSCGRESVGAQSPIASMGSYLLVLCGILDIDLWAHPSRQLGG